MDEIVTNTDKSEKLYEEVRVFARALMKEGYNLHQITIAFQGCVADLEKKKHNKDYEF